MKNNLNITRLFLSFRYIIPLLLIAVISVSIFLSIKSCNETIDEKINGISEIAEKFRSGNITYTFISSMPEIISTNGNILEIALLKKTEIFTRKDSQTMFWGTLELGENIVEIRVPVTYRYHIKLSDPWKLEVKDNACVVFAPEIRASQPPAIHTDKMQKYIIKEGWARFDAQRSLDDLQQNLTPRLMEIASSKQQINTVDDESRKSVEQFVKNWLLRENQWGGNKFNDVKVFFPSDEEYHKRIQTLQPDIENQ